jgi:hypothetical protein
MSRIWWRYASTTADRRSEHYEPALTNARVCKSDHNAKPKSDILVNDAEHERKTGSNEAGKCERGGDHSALQGIRSENTTVFRDCGHEEPGKSLPGNEWSTSRTEKYAVKDG